MTTDSLPPALTRSSGAFGIADTEVVVSSPTVTLEPIHALLGGGRRDHDLGVGQCRKRLDDRVNAGGRVNPSSLETRIVSFLAEALVVLLVPAAELSSEAAAGRAPESDRCRYNQHGKTLCPLHREPPVNRPETRPDAARA